MAASTRQYFQDDCTVLSFNTTTGMLTELGRGTIRLEADEATNDALMDEWEDGKVTKARATFEGEVAADTDPWLAQFKARGTLTCVTTHHTITGTFECVSAELVLEDAMRYNVTLKSRGEVTIS